MVSSQIIASRARRSPFNLRCSFSNVNSSLEPKATWEGTISRCLSTWKALAFAHGSGLAHEHLLLLELGSLALLEGDRQHWTPALAVAADGLAADGFAATPPLTVCCG